MGEESDEDEIRDRTAAGRDPVPTERPWEEA
jgi:hypothetical protein